MILGIDGEGIGQDEHRYVMLAYSDATGAVKGVLRLRPYKSRLSTVECLDFLLRTPKRATLIGYALGYDYTHILRDLDDKTLYALYHPESREGPHGPEPVLWGRYKLNWLQGRLDIAYAARPHWQVTVWDVFKFFQSSFVKALETWNVGSREDVLRIAHMKAQRGDFEHTDSAQVERYCLTECKLLAHLAVKLMRAHEKAGLSLRTLYGPGSTASSVLDSMGIEDMTRDAPEPMARAVACAFSGGRFENGILGRVDGPVYSYDINSAYPYATTFLPCLDCGHWRWSLSLRDAMTAKAALVKHAYDARKNPPAWAPFFHREPDGSICYPSRTQGWAWQSEFREALAAWPGVEFHGAWILDSQCDHRPFADVPRLYLERLRLGKDGPGIVLKLAVNSLYGKLAQSIGKPRYQCWIWAGMITAHTRAMILRAIRCHRDPRNLLWIATDGIYTRERLDLPDPIDTGTMTEHRKPLGGWDVSVIDGAMFAARPGIYFAVNDDAKLRGRGIGRAVLLRYRDAIMDAHAQGRESVTLESVRFHGAKSSLSLRGDGTVHRGPDYGQWRPWKVELTFDPMPKRVLDRDGRLRLRDCEGESAPYSKSDPSPEALLMGALDAMIDEQPH